MKKFFLFILLALSSVSYAQILRVEAVEKDEYLGFKHYFYLSDGSKLMIFKHKELWGEITISDKETRIKTDIDPAKVKVGSLFEKRGLFYTMVSMYKVSDKTIKYAKIRQVSSEFNASLYGSFSYGTFLSIGGGRGNISGNASGGKRTLVNIVFTDNTSTSIEASEDPIWLEAAAGMKVEHYKCGTCNIYKLLFN